jgi:hypothetical protein
MPLVSEVYSGMWAQVSRTFCLLRAFWVLVFQSPFQSLESILKQNAATIEGFLIAPSIGNVSHSIQNLLLH